MLGNPNRLAAIPTLHEVQELSRRNESTVKLTENAGEYRKTQLILQQNKNSPLGFVM
jgi:hypothetical protein